MLKYRIVLLVAATCLLLFAVLFYPHSPELLPDDALSRRILGNSIYEVGELDHYLIDERRGTAANGPFSGLAHRELDTRIWYPMVEGQAVAPGQHPLLIFGHGFSSGKASGASIARFLARQGYIVAAVDFPLSQVGAPGGATAADVINQPGDVSFLIDTLLSWSLQPASVFHGRIDGDRIGFIGVSLGGLTGAQLLFDPELRDQRVRFGIAVAAPLAGLERRWLQRARQPFMVIASKHDALIDYRRHALQMVDRIPGATLVSLSRASHGGFSDFSRFWGWLGDPDLVTCARVRSKVPQDPYLARLLIGNASAAAGQASQSLSAVCKRRPGEAMDPRRQQRIMALAAYHFVQQQFADTGAEIAFAVQNLHTTLPEEFGGSVSVEAGYSAFAEVSPAIAWSSP